MNKKAIVAVSFGSSYEEARNEGIMPVENRIRQVFQGYDIFRAFTSEIIIKKLKEREGIITPNISTILGELCQNGYEEIIVQPLHIIAGHEYDKVVDSVQFSEKHHPGITFRLGKPLLFDKQDYPKVAEAIKRQLMQEDWPEKSGVHNGSKVVIFMGHGTSHQADESYRNLGRHLRKWDERIWMATVEGAMPIENVRDSLKRIGVKEVELRPFMLCAGDHARNDLAGAKDSWKSFLEKEGFDVTTRLSGLGLYPGIQDRYVSHCVAAVPVPIEPDRNILE